MFALPRHPYAPSYQSYYNPYEQLILEQELERRRAGAYRRQQLEIGQLNRRRQYEYARRQAELQHQRQAEMEREARRRTIAERASQHRQSTLGGGMEDLFDMLYGGRVLSSPCQERFPPFGGREASPEPTARSEKTDGAAEEKAIAAQDPSLSAGSSKQADDLPTAPKDEPESGSVRTDETHLPDTAGSHAAAAGILVTFASLSSNFTFPSQLDFSSPSSSDSPKLAYTPNNAPLHQYEHELTGLLTQLDAVESYGDGDVRKARKEAVKRIEKELAELDKRKMEEWRKQSAPEMEVGAEQQAEGEIPTGEVDAAKIPLSEDPSDEDGQMNVAGCESPVGSLPLVHSPPSRLPSPHEHAQISRTSLGEASSSDDSDSEVEDYVDVEADVVSAAETEETEEAEVEQERDLVGLDEWELDF
ncbi:hypothetical protein FRC06_007039 [Ceratobasidium sp. 370]|nr:hypothetical protein FRC06_007039 [Ceratobasidium sp. 370]